MLKGKESGGGQIDGTNNEMLKGKTCIAYFAFTAWWILRNHCFFKFPKTA